MTELIHYSDPHSRGMRTQALLDYYKIPHRTVLVNLRQGDHKKPEYADIHPYRRVPALRDGELTLIESGAITLYLADKYASEMNTPAPATPERARLYEWLFFLQTTLESEAIKVFNPETKEEGIRNIRELLTAMAPRFQGPFALGEQETLLDVVLRLEMTWYKMLGAFPDGLEPYESLLQRASAPSA